MRVSGAAVHRTQYRPIRWTTDETVVLACGVAAAAAVAWVGATADPALLFPTTNPLSWPTLTLLLVASVALAALPAVLAPHGTTPRRIT